MRASCVVCLLILCGVLIRCDVRILRHASILCGVLILRGVLILFGVLVLWHASILRGVLILHGELILCGALILGSASILRGVWNLLGARSASVALHTRSCTVACAWPSHCHALSRTCQWHNWHYFVETMQRIILPSKIFVTESLLYCPQKSL